LTIIAYDEHIAIIKAINGLQLYKVAGERAKISIHIYSSKAIIAQDNNASHYSR